jgi:hypothetical protein
VLPRHFSFLFSTVWFGSVWLGSVQFSSVGSAIVVRVASQSAAMDSEYQPIADAKTIERGPLLQQHPPQSPFNYEPAVRARPTTKPATKPQFLCCHGTSQSPLPPFSLFDFSFLFHNSRVCVSEPVVDE